jgi:hypothetical protein
VIAIATGFDIVTGGMTNMGLKSIHGTTLQHEWKSAANTYLGTTVSGYPNMFHLYGPVSPFFYWDVLYGSRSALLSKIYTNSMDSMALLCSAMVPRAWKSREDGLQMQSRRLTGKE